MVIVDLDFTYRIGQLRKHKQRGKGAINQGNTMKLIISFWLVCIVSVVDAAEYTFTDINVPGAEYTVPEGINDLGDAVGGYAESIFLDAKGFLYSDGEFFEISSVPNSITTVPSSINNRGVVV